MNVLTVSQVNKFVKALLDENVQLKYIYISGEISNFKHHRPSGHMYFTLKDEKSQLKAAMFMQNNCKLKFIPEDGMKVICSGRISAYEARGECQLYVNDMHPEGIGALNLAFEQLKEKLRKEGAFDEELKKTLPQFPKRIGVVTSNQGAAVEDIKSITKRRYPFAEIVIVPTLVQGEQASADIVASIRLLDDMEDIDVIIVGRGGGSIEDLWAFNTEGVARAVIACKTPIVSAVGHETDFTICDFVSDLRAATPSAAAELTCPDINNFANDLYMLKIRLNSNINYIIEKNMQCVSELSHSPVLENYGNLLNSYKEDVDILETRLADSVSYICEYRKMSLSALAGRLNALSPLAVLARGYSVAKKENEIIKSVSQINVNDKIVLALQDGRAMCTVDEVENNG